MVVEPVRMEAGSQAWHRGSDTAAAVEAVAAVVESAGEMRLEVEAQHSENQSAAGILKPQRNRQLHDL